MNESQILADITLATMSYCLLCASAQCNSIAEHKADWPAYNMELSWCKMHAVRSVQFQQNEACISMSGYCTMQLRQ